MPCAALYLLDADGQRLTRAGASGLPCDDAHPGVLDLAAGQVATAIANARADAEERRRAGALAEIDRAKRAFCSNLSHELRTPLTQTGAWQPGEPRKQ